MRNLPISRDEAELLDALLEHSQHYLADDLRASIRVLFGMDKDPKLVEEYLRGQDLVTNK